MKYLKKQRSNPHLKIAWISWFTLSVHCTHLHTRSYTHVITIYYYFVLFLIQAISFVVWDCAVLVLSVYSVSVAKSIHRICISNYRLGMASLRHNIKYIHLSFSKLSVFRTLLLQGRDSAEPSYSKQTQCNKIILSLLESFFITLICNLFFQTPSESSRALGWCWEETRKVESFCTLNSF